MKVLNARSHVGAQIGAKVLTSLDDKKNNLEMEADDRGVWVVDRAGLEHPDYKCKVGFFIPHSTFCSQMYALDDVKAQMAKIRGDGGELGNADAKSKKAK